MKRIFIVHWVWYCTNLLILISDAELSLVQARLIGMGSVLSFLFVCLGPVYHRIYGKRSRPSDQRFMNACLSSGVIRGAVWCLTFWGLYDNTYILAINALGMLAFLLIEGKMKKISKAYFDM